MRRCARPPFALEHWHQHDAGHLLYDMPKPRLDGPRAEVLTPLELIDNIAALVPPVWFVYLIAQAKCSEVPVTGI